MPAKEFTFYGVAHPERAAINVDQLQLQASLGDNGLSMTMRVDTSMIYVTVTLETPTDDADGLRNSVQTVVQTVLDSYAATRAFAYRADIRGATYRDSGNLIQRTFGVYFDGLDRDAPMELEFGQLRTLALHEPQLAEALSELARAVDWPGTTLMHSYRAIEACGRWFAEPQAREIDWSKMNWALNMEASYARQILEDLDAHPVRHGQRRSVTAIERREALIIARIVVNRFALYLQQGKTPLTDLERLSNAES